MSDGTAAAPGRRPAPWLVVTAKVGRDAKQRLADLLGPEDRGRLMRRLLAHTLDVALGASSAPVMVVLKADPGAPVTLEAPGDRVVVLPDDGTNPDEAAAAGMAAAFAMGAPSVAYLAADLPLLDAASLRALLRAAAPSCLVLAADRFGTGTNALVVPEPGFPFRFGPGSLARHAASGVERGWMARVVRVPGLAVDLDEPWDLDLACRVADRHGAPGEAAAGH